MTLLVHLDPKQNVVVLELEGHTYALEPADAQRLSDALFRATIVLAKTRAVHLNATQVLPP